MRFSAPVMAFFFAFKNTIRISPLTTFNNDIYHYNPTFDIYRYGSKDRKLFKKIQTSSARSSCIQNS